MMELVEAVFGLTGVLLVHELGHLLAARACGMRATELSVGIGPRVAGFRAGGTDWSLRLLPLAAFVRVAGMSDRRDLHPRASWSFRAGTARARAVVLVSGPAANLLLAALLIGAAQFHPMRLLRPAHPSVRPSPPSPPSRQAPAPDAAPDERRDSSHADGSARASLRELGHEVTTGLGRAGTLVTGQVEGLANVIGGATSWRALSGPVGTLRWLARMAHLSWRSRLRMLALLSVSLAVFNLLPLPVFDGGRLVLLLAEVVTRRTMSDRLEHVLDLAGTVALLALFVATMCSDLLAWASERRSASSRTVESRVPARTGAADAGRP